LLDCKRMAMIWTMQIKTKSEIKRKRI
jgi:hypothetical protein